MASTARVSGAKIAPSRTGSGADFRSSMRTQISGQQIDIGDALRTHVGDRLSQNVAKYFDHPIEANVNFAREGEGYGCTVSVHVHSGLTMFAEGSSGDIYASFDQAAERMETRLRRHKRRLKAHKGRGPVDDIEARAFVIDGGADEDEDADRAEPAVIAEAPASVATLRVGDAVMRLDLSGEPLLLFRNAGHGGLNVVYRRTDGHIGWIDPAFDPQR